jgi:hypothetical protein
MSKEREEERFKKGDEKNGRKRNKELKERERRQ